MSGDEKGFEVKDRRKVKEALEGESAGQEQRDEKPAQGAPPAGESGGESQAGGRDEGAKESASEAQALPPLDFLSFVSSIAATAFMHLGEKFSQGQPELPVDLLAAKQMIDLLELIKAKTKGNLDRHEEDGLDSILYNLRMRYVQKSKGN